MFPLVSVSSSLDVEAEAETWTSAPCRSSPSFPLGELLGKAEIVESLSTPGVVGSENGFRLLSANIPPGVKVSSVISSRLIGGGASGLLTLDSPVAGVGISDIGWDGGSSSLDFVSFSSASATDTPATLRSSELKTS